MKRTSWRLAPTLLVLYGGPLGREYFFTETEVHDDPKLNRFYPHNRLDEMTRRRSVWVRHDAPGALSFFLRVASLDQFLMFMGA